MNDFSKSLAWYGRIYLWLGLLSAMGYLGDMLANGDWKPGLVPLVYSLLLAVIGYGIMKKRRAAFTLLYFLNYAVFFVFILLISQMVRSGIFAPFLLIGAVMLALHLPPLFLVRPYWDDMPA